MEILYSLGQFFLSSFYISLQFLIILVEIRYLTNWFLNVNPFFEPFVTLWTWTNPIFNFGRRWYPRIFGLDITPIINYKALNAVLQICDDLLGYTPPMYEDDGSSSVTFSPIEAQAPQYHISLEETSSYLDLTTSFLSNFII